MRERTERERERERESWKERERERDRETERDFIYAVVQGVVVLSTFPPDRVLLRREFGMFYSLWIVMFTLLHLPSQLSDAINMR